MFLICGTIPQENLLIITGKARFVEDKLFIENREIPCTQGTAALVSAACVTAQHLKSSPPNVVLAGDIGNGKGSRLLYDYLSKNLALINPDILLMHYILPVMGLMKKVCEAAAKCSKKPVMIADASSMYAAKAAGLASEFDIFTPDLCEMAFLADPDAIHPAYISHHLFGAEIADAKELITAAYRLKSVAKTVIIKGAVDHIVQEGKITFTLNEPDIPALEAIGGTGDTISGMVGAFIEAGFTPYDAAVAALKTNRQAGLLAKATPATKIHQIVAAIPNALKNN